MFCIKCSTPINEDNMTILIYRKGGEYDGANLFCDVCLPPDNLTIKKCTPNERMQYVISRLKAHGIYRPSLMGE